MQKMFFVGCPSGQKRLTASSQPAWTDRPISRSGALASSGEPSSKVELPFPCFCHMDVACLRTTSICQVLQHHVPSCGGPCRYMQRLRVHVGTFYNMRLWIEYQHYLVNCYTITTARPDFRVNSYSDHQASHSARSPVAAACPQRPPRVGECFLFCGGHHPGSQGLRPHRHRG